MKLFEVPKNTRVRVIDNPNTPPDGKYGLVGNEYFFYHVDGMYSFCTDHKGDPVHLAAWTEVEIVE